MNVKVSCSKILKRKQRSGRVVQMFLTNFLKKMRPRSKQSVLLVIVSFVTFLMSQPCHSDVTATSPPKSSVSFVSFIFVITTIMADEAGGVGCGWEQLMAEEEVQPTAMPTVQPKMIQKPAVQPTMIQKPAVQPTVIQKPAVIQKPGTCNGAPHATTSLVMPTASAYGGQVEYASTRAEQLGHFTDTTSISSLEHAHGKRKFHTGQHTTLLQSASAICVGLF